MSDDEAQPVGEAYNQDDDQSMENDGMDELFGEDGDSGNNGLPTVYDFPYYRVSSLTPCRSAGLSLTGSPGSKDRRAMLVN